MTAKEITTKWWKTIFPIVKLEAAETIKDELADATNTSILELWEKVKPLFIEEFEDVKADLEDEDAQGAARTKIKKALEQDENLKTEIETLLAKTDAASSNQGGITVNNRGAEIKNQTNIDTNHGNLTFH